MIELAEIETARGRIKGAAVRTPLVRLYHEQIPAGTEIYLKLELLQPINDNSLITTHDATRQRIAASPNAITKIKSSYLDWDDNAKAKIQAMNQIERSLLNDMQQKALKLQSDRASAQKRVSVYVVDEKNRLQRRTLTLGMFDGSNSEIIGGAAEGDMFVTRAHIGDEKKPKPI